MLRVTAEHLRGRTPLERVVFVLFDEAARKAFEQTWAAMQQSEPRA